MDAARHRGHSAARPNGLPSLSVAHYGEQNGDLMRDPEMLFEMRREAGTLELDAYYWRNDYLGIEEYSSLRDNAAMKHAA